MNSRRGFTLIELLFSLFMMVIVAGGIYTLMVTVYRVTRTHTEISKVQGNLRAGMELTKSELQEIYTDAATGASDIVSGTATAITYSSMRGIGETCGITPGGGAVQIRQSSYSGRIPEQGRDILWLFQDRDTLVSTDDVWLPKPITGVAAGTCTILPADPSWDLAVPSLVAAEVIDPVGGVDPLVHTPGPIRTAETMEMGLVTDAGDDWLGIRSVSGLEAALTPVMGPLETGGVDFRYLDGGNVPTGTMSAVKSIVLKLRGISPELVHTGLGSALATKTDSVVVRVHLRNSR
jgi:prepilin-type N-terminal cleavage/methylation domain-containing protein